MLQAWRLLLLHLFLGSPLLSQPHNLSDYAFPQQEQPVGFVLEIEGDWVANEKQLQLGAQVTAGTMVRLRSAEKDSPAHITVILLDKQEFSRTCSDAKECLPIAIPARLASESSLRDKIVEAVMLLFSRKPERYVPALSRTQGTEAIAKDGIIELQQGSIGIGPPLLYLRGTAGSIILRFVPLRFEDDTYVGSESEGVIINLGLKNFSFAPSRRLVAGLYRVSVLDSTQPGLLPTGVEFWVLVVPSAEYKEAFSTFSNAETITEGWGLGVGSTAQRSFMRAVIYDLSQKAVR